MTFQEDVQKRIDVLKGIVAQSPAKSTGNIVASIKGLESLLPGAEGGAPETASASSSTSKLGLLIPIVIIGGIAFLLLSKKK